MSRLAALLLCATLLPAVAQANAPSLAQALQDQEVVGQARLRVWGFSVYDATLYAAPGFDAQRFAEQRFALELAYLRDFDGADIAERSLQEMGQQSAIDEATGSRWLQAMRATFPDVRAGDRITGVHLPGTGARFYLNGRLLGVIDDPRFARRFFAIWLSPQTSQPAMRERLLRGPTAAEGPR